MQAPCILCGHTVRIPVDYGDVVAWRASSDYVQDRFPELSANEREFLISGICGVCFDFNFPEDEVCNDLCMTASDIGLPEYGSMVAYAHPECPEHGEYSR